MTMRRSCTEERKEASVDIDIRIGRRLFERRTSVGLSQNLLAQKLQIDSYEIEAYEKGVKQISAARLLRIAWILGVRPNYFFHFSDECQHSAAEHFRKRFEETKE